ncbi:MAG TPA: hypothetical protein P5514_01350 [Bacteroidales bacterium]|nr:hypothetical protein [Bacteroidales bacterium]HRX95562.1 hypothetical protein [Bacteroidales bacterium]
MKPQNNFDDQIRKMIIDSADHFGRESENSKERIWQHVQLKKEKRVALLWFRALAAACLLLLLVTSILVVSKVKNDNRLKTLVIANSSLEDQIYTMQQEVSTKPEVAIVSKASVPDTIYVEKTITVAQPSIKTEFITDTVYVDRTIYVEKENTQEMIAVNDPPSTVDTITQIMEANDHEKQIIIRNNSNQKQAKIRKLKIKLGGNKPVSKRADLALKTEL